MPGAAGLICVLAALLLAVSIADQSTYADTRAVTYLPWRIERDIRRFKFAGNDNVMDLLAIRPGMTILDIGAGTGQFAYEFSRRLSGTGKVYATDTQAYCVEYMKKESARRGLDNIYPVLVRKDGLDEFYAKHRYDLVAIFHVAMAYDNQVDYLRELRGYLADGGRLALILKKNPTLFSLGDFTGDFRGLVDELSREPADSPFHRILKGSTRALIRENSGMDPSLRLRRAVVEDFNDALLSEVRFFKHFMNGSVLREDTGLSPGERAFADFLLMSFKERTPADGGIPGRPLGSSAPAGPRSAKTLTDPVNSNQLDGVSINKLIIVNRFRMFMKRDGLYKTGFSPEIKGAFEKAGYRLQRVDPDIIPFEDMVIFSAR